MQNGSASSQQDGRQTGDRSPSVPSDPRPHIFHARRELDIPPQGSPYSCQKAKREETKGFQSNVPSLPDYLQRCGSFLDIFE